MRFWQCLPLLSLCYVKLSSAFHKAAPPTMKGDAGGRPKIKVTGVKSSPSKATPSTPSSSSSSKPNPLETIFRVYTEGNEVKQSVEELALKKDRKYTLITGLPLKPYFERKTVRTQISENIWAFEQPQGFFNVTTSIRMTVIRLQDGGLWVHAPVAPTTECKRLLHELGTIKYIVLPTTGFEHKVFVGPFASAYPKAKVYVCPGQWSWPINLPPPFRIDGYLKDQDTNTPWADEIDQLLLEPPKIGIGPANEVVFFHKPTETLLVTDLVVFIDGNSPSPVVDIPELLKASLDDPENGTTPPDSPANRRRGYARMVLQILFLGPAKFSTFKLVSKRLLVSPVIETFVYSKVPEALVDFIDRVTSRWAFTSIIPAHFNAPARATPADLQKAFAFAYKATKSTPTKPATSSKSAKQDDWIGALFGGLIPSSSSIGGAGKPVVYPESDMAVLNAVNKFIIKAGVANK